MFECMALNSLSNSLFWSGGFWGGGDEFLVWPSFFCRSRYAFAPKTFLPDLRFLLDSVGELSPPVKAKLGSPPEFAGMTEVMKALVERIPSLPANFVLIDIEEGSFSRPPSWPDRA